MKTSKPQWCNSASNNPRRLLCRGDPLASLSMGCLLQCPWGLFLTASTSLHRKIPKCVSFEQSWYIGLFGCVFVVLNKENNIFHMAFSFS
jgi:hypothetical protein